MADSRDKPELETLGYKPTIAELEEILEKGGSNSIEIMPNGEIRVAEKSINCICESYHNRTGKHINGCPEQPKGNHSSTCASLNHQYADCTCVGQPNKNLMIIEEIEGLMSQVNDKIHKLTFSHNTLDITKKQTLWSQAIEEIDLFQKTTLFELRKAFE